MKLALLVILALPLCADTVETVSIGTPEILGSPVTLIGNSSGGTILDDFTLGEGVSTEIIIPFTISVAANYVVDSTLSFDAMATACNPGGACGGAGADITSALYLDGKSVGLEAAGSSPDSESSFRIQASDSGYTPVQFLNAGLYSILEIIGGTSYAGGEGEIDVTSTFNIVDPPAPVPEPHPMLILAVGVLAWIVASRWPAGGRN